MNNLTAEKCRELIAECQALQERGYLSISGCYKLQALEIALPVLEQQEKGCPSCGGNRHVEIDHGEMGIEHMICPKCTKNSTTPQIDNDGWVEWKGGECPVGNGRIDLKLRDDSVTRGIPAEYCDWSHENRDLDIIAYRVIEGEK